MEVERKIKGIRARLSALLATKGNLINKGFNANAVRKDMLSSAELLEFGQMNSYKYFKKTSVLSAFQRFPRSSLFPSSSL
ncbi:MAG: hypothetical protein LBL39_04825 [Planctomycetaceae bacterium]|nr:hypothetical protein [Planctomycetaceae bacterium]